MFVNNFIHSGKLSEDERELYEYGFFILVSNILFICITIIFGLVFKTLIQSLIFFGVFIIIRQYAGGYHAATELRCEVFTTLCIFISNIAMRLINDATTFTILLTLTFILIIVIFLFAPIDTDEKTLSEQEVKVFCKKTKLILIIVVAAILVSFYLKIKSICIPCCIGVILEGVLLITGKIQKNRMGKCEEY